MNVNLQQSKKWFDNKVLLILLIFILPPLGIYGVWKRKGTKDLKKAIYTILGFWSSAFLLLVIIALFIDSNKMYYNNGISEFEGGNYKEALENFQKVEKDFVNYPNAMKKIAEIKSAAERQKENLNKELEEELNKNSLKNNQLLVFQMKWADSVVKSWRGEFIIASEIHSIETISFELSKNATKSYNSNVSQALPMYISDYKNAIEAKFGNQFATVNTKIIFSPNKKLSSSSKPDEYSNPIIINTGLKIYTGNKYSKTLVGTVECKSKDESDGMTYFHIVKSDGSISRIEESNLRLNYFVRKDDSSNSNHSGVNKCY